MTIAFVPAHFPRTKIAGGRVLSDAQQHQYDVLRTVGGKLIKRNEWYREVPYTDSAGSAMIREKIYGLNITAMWKIVEFGLVECTKDVVTGGYLFMLPARAKDLPPSPRYVQRNHIVKEITQ